MNSKDLKCFCQVYEDKSINKAAQKLFITPQGLGKTIHNLEEELNTTLFERTNRGASATASADLLYQKSQLFMNELEEMKNEIQQLDNKKQVLRIGCACGTFHLLPLSIIYEFMKENNNVSVEWCEYTNDYVKEILDLSQIEYGFIVGDWDRENMQTKLLDSCSIQLLVYEGHPLYHHDLVRLEMLQDEKVILMNEQFHMYSDITKALECRDITVDVIAKTADIAFLHQLCLQKQGIAIVPEFFRKHYNMQHLKLIPFEENIRWQIYSVYKKELQNYDLIHEFNEFLNKHI